MSTGMSLPRLSVRDTHALQPRVTLGLPRTAPAAINPVPHAPRTSVEIAADRDAAVAERNALEASRSDLMLTGTADEVADLDHRIGIAKVLIDQAEMWHAAAVIAEAKERADHEAEQIRRKALRKAAMKASAEAAKLADRYVGLAKEMASVLSQLRERERLIAEANAALPDGAEPVPPGELFNGVEPAPGRYETVRETVWIDNRDGSRAGVMGSNDLQHRVAKTVERQVRVPGTPGEPHIPLSHRVTLPGLGRGTPPIWGRNPYPITASTGR